VQQNLLRSLKIMELKLISIGDKRLVQINIQD